MWTLDPSRFSALRAARGLTRDAFAKRIGLAAVTLRRWESDAGPVRAFEASVLAAAQALGCEPTAFATPVGRRIVSPSAPTREVVNPLRKPSSLAALASEEDAQPDAEVPTLSAGWLRSVFSAFRAHEGRRFRARCSFEEERGLSFGEAATLGCPPGVGVKLKSRVTRKGAPLDITLCTTEAAHTCRLQAALREKSPLDLGLIVRAFDRGTLWTWESTTPRPWALVVTEVAS